ncbi:MAG: hypothetical protein WCW67_08230 [Candidatus Margulisiibacteriota bacterium]|jgi:protein tyrosine phosphatase (PTP) superfamily phosphohydrolase (DUF442 family)
MRKTALFLAAFVILIVSGTVVFAETSICQKFPAAKVTGQGPIPYNCRLIDGHILAGGHPLNPRKFENTDQQVAAIFKFLKEEGVENIIDLENSSAVQKRYARLLEQAGLTRLHVPMNNAKVPTAAEWAKIKELMKQPVYIHCRWGADRTGAVIARYLIEEAGYSTVEAWQAVVNGGSHAGLLGGLKNKPDYRNLILFISPKAADYQEFKAYF